MMIDGQNSNQVGMLLKQLGDLVALLRGNASVTAINPNLTILQGARNPRQIIQLQVTAALDSVLPGAGMFTNIALLLFGPSPSPLRWRDNSYANMYGMSYEGYRRSIQAVLLLKQIVREVPTAFNRALSTAANGRQGDALQGFLLMFGLDRERRAASLRALLISMRAMTARYGKLGNARGFLKDMTDATAAVTALAAMGRYYGGFAGPQVATLAGHLATRGIFDDLQGGSYDAKSRLLAVRKRIRLMTDALSPLKDIFGTDILSMITSLLSIYGTGIGAIGASQLRQLAANIRGTMYTSNASLQLIAQARSAAAQMRTSLNPTGANNLALLDTNLAASYVRMTTGAPDAAYISRPQAMADTMLYIVDTANSLYADSMNRLYGAWLSRAENKDKSVDDFRAWVGGLQDSKIDPLRAGMRALGINSVADLQRGVASDYALRSGLGASYAASQYFLLLKQRVIEDLMWSNTDTQVRTIANNLTALQWASLSSATSDPGTFAEKLKLLGITATGDQGNALYRMMVNQRYGADIGTLARGRVIDARRQAVMAELLKARAVASKAQLDSDVDLTSDVGLWQYMMGASGSGSAALRQARIKALLEASGLESSAFSLTAADNNKIDLKFTDSKVQEAFAQLSGKDKAKVLAAMPTLLLQSRAADGTIDYKKLSRYISGVLYIGLGLTDVRSYFSLHKADDRLKMLFERYAKDAENAYMSIKFDPAKDAKAFAAYRSSGMTEALAQRAVITDKRAAYLKTSRRIGADIRALDSIADNLSTLGIDTKDYTRIVDAYGEALAKDRSTTFLSFVSRKEYANDATAKKLLLLTRHGSGSTVSASSFVNYMMQILDAIQKLKQK